MGNYNSCFDYDKVNASASELKSVETPVNGIWDVINVRIENLTSADETHNALKSLEQLESYKSTFQEGYDDLVKLSDAMTKSSEAYSNSENDIEAFLKDFSDIVKNDLGNSTVAGYVAGYIVNGIVTGNTLATTSEEFLEGATEEVTSWIAAYALSGDDNCPPNYNNSEEWKKKLMEKYQEEGYSSYDAEDLAEAEMAQWRVTQTGEYEDLVDKYQELGLDESQAKELATAESEYKDAESEFLETQGEDVRAWENSEAKQKYDEWKALKEEYGVADAESTTESSTTESTTSSATSSSGGGTTSSSNYQYRTQSYSSSSNSGGSTGSAIGSSSNSGGTSSSSSSNNTSPTPPSETPSTSGETSTPSETPSTPETSTPSGENNDTSEPIIEEEVPTDETPNTGDSNNTNTENNNSSTTTPPSTDTGESNTSTSTGNTSQSSGSNNSSGGYVSSGNNSGYTSNAGGSFEDPTTSAGTPNENASTTTPSAPDSDAGIKDNSGETLDVISIDKETTNTPSTSSNDGGSVIPAVLGVGVAGAAVAGGAKIIHDKKNKDEMYSYDDEESEEDNNSFSYLNSYDDNSSETEAQEAPATRYRAGSANKLVLEDAPENINIEESATDIPGSGEELE